MNLAATIFKTPQVYRNLLLEKKLIQGEQKEYTGKTFICVSLTRFCPVGCKFCFFKSGPMFKQPTKADILTEEGIDKFIQFSNDINLGYLLVSGGGEPMMEKNAILRIIEEVESERIVLVTSAFWAKNKDNAKRYLDSICERLKKRKSPTSVTVRVSIDEGHQETLGLDPIINLINLFYSTYRTIDGLDLQIHSLNDDPTISKLVETLADKYKINRHVVSNKRISDGMHALKIVPKQEIISFNDFDVKIGYAKIFYSNLRVDLKNDVSKNIDVYQKDLYESEDGNSSVVTNTQGNPGLDFWVNYNGNVTTWGNQYLDNLFNLYTDDAKTIIEESLSDPAALAFIEKGADYRDRIISEVNDIAVKRSKAVNIRDYTGALMFDEERTRLYFTIRALQDYVLEGRINMENVSSDLREILSIDKQDLIDAYERGYNIVDQTVNKPFQKDSVLDIVEWIQLGHYKVVQSDLLRLIDFYNSFMEDQKITLNDPLPNDYKMQIVRMTEYLTHIKPEALKTTLKQAA